MRFNTHKSLSVVAQKNDMARMRLFCFPYAGGGAQAYRQWPDSLPDHVQVCAVQPPGRENRFSEPPIANIHELVSRLIPAIAPFLDKSFIFFGHSTGALVAFEMIRGLRRQQLPLPEHFIVAAARAPHIPEPSPLHNLSENEFIRELRRFSGTPDTILRNKELMALYLPLLRADFALEETYTFKEELPLDIPISAFWGDLDTEAPMPMVAQWKEHSISSFTLTRMAGGHFFTQTAKSSFLASVAHLLDSI